MKLFAVLTSVADLLQRCARGRGERTGRWLGGGRRKGIGDLVVPVGTASVIRVKRAQTKEACSNSGLFKGSQAPLQGESDKSR
ncbi:hypothetical protein TIFTF001_007360 [Ficus carica]|uniref:Uncharacterized protein n=1 Tax=Ficus carica TaxID=3494 RepID=A0AA88A2U4_FICCA|nr:hypothetical protein TIFTF001_007360 [Ficus carica]